MIWSGRGARLRSTLGIQWLVAGGIPAVRIGIAVVRRGTGGRRPALHQGWPVTVHNPRVDPGRGGPGQPRVGVILGRGQIHLAGAPLPLFTPHRAPLAPIQHLGLVRATLLGVHVGTGRFGFPAFNISTFFGLPLGYLVNYCPDPGSPA